MYKNKLPLITRSHIIYYITDIVCILSALTDKRHTYMLGSCQKAWGFCVKMHEKCMR